MKSGSLRSMPDAAQRKHRLRHVEIDHDPPPDPLQGGPRHGGQFRMRRQLAEHLVEHAAERRRVDVADRRDLEPVARQHAAHEAAQVFGGDERNGFQRAVGRPAVGMVGECRLPPQPAGDVVRVGGLAPQRRRSAVRARARPHALSKRGSVSASRSSSKPWSLRSRSSRTEPDKSSRVTANRISTACSCSRRWNASASSSPAPSSSRAAAM